MINFGRSKPKIPLILLFSTLLSILIVSGQFGLENGLNRGKSLFGSIFGRNAPKNGQNKLAKNTTIFTTNSTATTALANDNINNSNLIGNNNSDFGLTTMSMSMAPKNATIGQQLTSRHLLQNNSLSLSISTTTINGFKNDSQTTNVIENQLSSTIPLFSNMNSSTAPISTLLNSNWLINSSISFTGTNFSMPTPNPFINATFHNFWSTAKVSPSILQNASSNHFEPTNSSTISPPISQINPSILNQNNQGNLLDEQNGNKINASNKLIESTENFTNQNKNEKKLNEFPSTKAILFEEKWQKENHEKKKTEKGEEKFGNGTNGFEQILNGTNQNGSILQIFNSPNRISPEEYSQNRTTIKINQQLFPSPSPLPVQQFVGNFSANQSSNLPNFNNNSLNDLNNLEKNLVKENVQQEKNGIIENKTVEMTKMNEKNGRQQNGNDNEIQQKKVQNNFGMIKNNNNETVENENANQITGNRTTKNETRIEVKNILKMANGIGNETQMEISKIIRNEQNGSKELMIERIETKNERKLEMNKTENKFDGNGRNVSILNGDQQNGLDGIQLNQANVFGIRTNQTLLGEFGWNQTLARENERTNLSIVGRNGTTKPIKLLNGFGLNESSSIKGNQQIKEISNKTNQIGGIPSNQSSLFDGIQSKHQENSVGFEGGDNLNQTLTKQKEILLDKTKNSTELLSNQMEMGTTIQNGNINGTFSNSITDFPSINSTASTSATTQLTIATTTQDPIVRKELEKVGAPDVLKQLVPPKAEPIPEQAKQIIEDKCANGKCLEQKAEFKEQRIVVSKQEEVVEQKLNPGKPVEQVKKEVEQRISKTFQLKKALIKSAGLEGKVEPANNGVFQADLLLTEEQATALIAELERQRAQKGQGGRKKRAGNAIFMENSATQRWPLNTPIQFMFDQSLVEKDRQAVKQAIAEIQSKTCLKFIEAYSKPAGSHLYYTKIANPTFCGLSYVGRIEPANPIYLSFMCGNEVGIGLHETLHALGFQHEQLRFDRDQFITIQWENVNPQQLDFFAISDVTKFSSYGLRYDYGSIMHYSATIAAQNPGKKTMMAKLAPAINDPLMGQRKGLSLSDVDALNKIYCSPGCEDKLVYCGLWATLNLCNPQMWRRVVTHQWIVSNCQKSCNKCGEKLEPVPNRPF